MQSDGSDRRAIPGPGDPASPNGGSWRTRTCRTGPGRRTCSWRCAAAPTLRHYDPESIEYWVTRGGRGRAARAVAATPMPLSEDFSWGMIRLVDRLRVTNEYLTFGGRLDAAMVDDAIVAAFTSPAPLLRRGGHSQGWDAGADLVGAFFGRLMVAVDYQPGVRGGDRRREPDRSLRGVHPRRGARRRAGRLRAPTASSVASSATRRCGCATDARRLGGRGAAAGLERHGWPIRLAVRTGRRSPAERARWHVRLARRGRSIGAEGGPP